MKPKSQRLSLLVSFHSSIARSNIEQIWHFCPVHRITELFNYGHRANEFSDEHTERTLTQIVNMPLKHTTLRMPRKFNFESAKIDVARKVVINWWLVSNFCDREKGENPKIPRNNFVTQRPVYIRMKGKVIYHLFDYVS